MADFSQAAMSGSGTATGTATVISSSEKQLQAGVWIQVRTGDADVEVIANGSSVGILVTAGSPMFFACDSFNDVLVKGSDTFYFWAS